MFVLASFILQFCYVNILRNRVPEVLETLSTIELVSCAMVTLGFMWLKFTILWRFFRLVALMDGVEVPENMARCFCNILLIQHFWRDWHASYNLWIVRYMYVPLGGSRRKVFTVLPIFVFVAFWHDVQMRLVLWGLIMAVAMIPEMMLQHCFSRPEYEWLQSRPYCRHLQAAGGSLSILLLVSANLVGFGIGAGLTVRGVASLVFAASNWSLLCVVGCTLFCTATFGIALRELRAANRAKQAVRLGLEGKGAISFSTM